MKKILSLLVVAGFLVSCNCNTGQKENATSNPVLDNIYSQLEFEMPQVKEPVISDTEYSIVDYGAIGDGKVLNTDAFAKAIEDASKNGGGKVVIPRGIWLTGPIVLKDNINLHAEAGALIIFSKDKSLYPIIETSFEGLDTYRCISPLYAKGVSNIAFTGSGVWDGSGDVWRHVKKSKVTATKWKKLVKSGGVLDAKGNIWFPSEEYKKAIESSPMNVPEHLTTLEEHEAIRDFLRPVLMSLVECKNVLLDGPTFQNSPAWCLHPLMCENMIIRNITVNNPSYSQNGDGLDIESCKNTILHDCKFDVGDDAICIKSGKDKDGRDRGIPNENLIVYNCIVYHGHGGVVVGSEMSGGVKNLFVNNCTFIGTDVGIRFKSTRGRGGVVENIYISDIEMVNIPATAVSFNMYYGGKSASESAADGDDKKIVREIPPVTEETPVFKDIFMENIRCVGAKTGIVLQGLPEMPLANVNIKNIHIEAENGFSCSDAEGVNIENMILGGEQKPVMLFSNNNDVTINGLEFAANSDEQIVISGADTKKLTISNVKNADWQSNVKVAKEVVASEVTFK